MTAAELLAQVLCAAVRETLETQPGVKRMRAVAGAVHENPFEMRNRLSVWAIRVRETCIERN